MKLYFNPGACSLSPHIALREAGLPFTLERVDTRAGKTESGADYKEINPRGYVPALQLEDGEVLTEGAAIVQYIADLKPEADLAPRPSTMARVRLQEELNFLSSELHKGFTPLFDKNSTEDAKAPVKKALARRYDDVEAKLADGRPFLMGERFSVADGYLFAITNWSGHVGFPLDRWPKVQAFMGRMAERPSVQAAMKAEGLLA